MAETRRMADEAKRFGEEVQEGAQRFGREYQKAAEGQCPLWVISRH